MSKQIYSFVGLKFDVDEAIELATKYEAKSIAPSKLADFIPKPEAERKKGFIPGMNPVDEDYAAKTTNTAPIIIAQGCYNDGEVFYLLIDGSHRLFKKLYIERSDAIDYVILSLEDSFKIASGPLTRNMEERLAKAS